jgi:hypothetical protein
MRWPGELLSSSSSPGARPAFSRSACVSRMQLTTREPRKPAGPLMAICRGAAHPPPRQRGGCIADMGEGEVTERGEC